MKPISMNFLENSSKFSLAFEIKKKVKSTQSRSTVTRESTFQTHAFSGLYVKINVGFHSTEGKPKAKIKSKIKSSLYSPHYAEACNELRGPSPRLSAWATQLRRNVATVASRWRHCADLTGPGIEPQTSRTESVRFATELTAGQA